MENVTVALHVGSVAFSPPWKIKLTVWMDYSRIYRQQILHVGQHVLLVFFSSELQMSFLIIQSEDKINQQQSPFSNKHLSKAVWTPHLQPDTKRMTRCKCGNLTSIDGWNPMLNYKSEQRLRTSNAGPLVNTFVSGINPAMDGHQHWSLTWGSMQSYWVKEIIWQ